MNHAHLLRRAVGTGSSRVPVTLAITALAILGLLAVAPIAALAAGSRTITLAAASYSPTLLVVEAGMTIIFDNTSAFPHTATAESGAFDTGMIAAGTSRSITISTPGTYPYYCQFHGAVGGVGQAGTITVTAATAQTPAPAEGGATTPTAGSSGVQPPSTATVEDFKGFHDLTGIALAIAVFLAVVLAMVIDAIRGRSAEPGAE